MRTLCERPKSLQPACASPSPLSMQRRQGEGGRPVQADGKGLSFAFDRIAVDTDRARPATPGLRPISEPQSTGASHTPDQPFGDFNEESETLASAAPDAAVQPVPQPGVAPIKAADAVTAAAPGPNPAPAPAAAAARMVIRGPRELWYFDGETPATYAVSAPLSANRRSGTFAWTVSPHLSLSSATGAAPTVTTAQASAAPGLDAWIRVRHAAPDGSTSVASYSLTVLAPHSLTHLRNVDSAHATWTYESRIHYSIMDQMGTVLPRNVPINEQWTGGIVEDHAGMNWRRGAEGAATVNPADWNDQIQGEHTALPPQPTPVAPADPAAGTAVYHWPGDWRVGSLTIGSGHRVSSVTWQKNLGFARHT